ncbi:hypothetical protein DDZ13_10310 [Coraliomargarita sinensis]|uniref:Sulfotransferase domain-containing protein n=1 Tax=Coraliomargarita sinensis TaxID=2174842 RepID=A0A317ZIT4_9BACT|nr:hypothetical protein DDZ13_10310 [Coraliomargarita sinensis]
MVLIREPKSAIISYLTFYADTHARLHPKFEHLLAKEMMRTYLAFYSYVLSVRDQVVVATFKEAIRDFGSIISRVNSKFHSDFDVFEHSTENVDAIFKTRPEHLSPSKRRDSLKPAFVDLIEDKRCRILLERCTRVYQKLIDSDSVKCAPIQ